MNARSPHEQVVRLAIITLCTACLTSGTQPVGQFDRRDRVSKTALKPHSAGEATHAPVGSGLEVLSEPDLATRRRLNGVFGQMPMCFEANQGQAASNARFVSAIGGPRLLLSPEQATFELRQSNPTGDEALRMHLVSADPGAEIRGLDLLPTRANYFIGNDPSNWHTNIPTYARVICKEVYPGVDMIYHGSQRQLEYDFVVAPGANAERIRLQFEGAQKTAVDQEGNLIIQAKEAEVRHNRPVAYQEADGVREEVRAAFSLFADGTAGFQIGEYDRTRELVIDPVLVFSTYLGGSAADSGRGIFVDSQGSAYVLGDSRSSDFTHGTVDNADIFIGKFSANGGAFTYAFFGGSKDDFATGLAVDSDGNTYISGSTQSDNLAGANSINSALSGPSDALVIRFNLDDGFSYSTIVGGTGDETGVSIAIDDAGNAYISGKTTSIDFPTVNAIQSAHGGGDSDAFVSKIAVDGASLVYSTYLGGSSAEDSVNRSGIAVDSAGNAYVTGDTTSTDFPLKDPIRSSNTGIEFDAYVSKIDPTGAAFVYSTYLGGIEDETGVAIATDAAGNAYVAGMTRSPSFTGSGSTRPPGATTDAYVAKLNPAGSAFSYLTFIGDATGFEAAEAIVVDASNNAYVTGVTTTGTGILGPLFPTVKPVQSYFAGVADVIVTRLSPAGVITFSTYLGGTGDETGFGIAVDSAGSIYVTGSTDSEDFLTTAAIREENAGGTDLFVSKIDPNTDSDKPLIYDVRIIGKLMFVFGQNFDNGAFVRLNGRGRGTNGGEDPTQILTSKKAAKKTKPGHTVQIQVQNGNGKRSDLFFFTRPD
ncbi:MAG: SBBP repeat-containing protein [Blastocatellia bacterium]